MHAVAQLLPAATKLGQVNIFSSVCQEFRPKGDGESAPLHAGIHHPPRTRHPPGPDPPGPDPPGPDPPGPDTPGAVHAGRYGQQAGGTHPTGMHTFFFVLIIWSRIFIQEKKRNEYLASRYFEIPKKALFKTFMRVNLWLCM